MPFGPGETFERYAIEALIGRGGMGEVYRAVDTRLRRKVALKIIRPDKDRPDAAARLYREARAAAALTHPNAVAVHDVGEAEGVFYIVMELVVGQPLLAFVGDPRVSVAKKIAWLTDVARALGAAHRAGIIHRDVKPSNVMVSEDGFPKVLDFGLARPLGPIDPVSFRTQEGRVLGTLRYMAPEQVAGADADARSDQYAFGLTAYELLAGTHPGGALIEAMPKRIDELAPEVPTEVARAVERMLARNPDDRYASMDEVVNGLEAATATLRAPPAPVTTPPVVTDEETAETMSAAATTAAGIGLGMRASSEDLGRAPTLKALANATTQPSREHEPHASTLVSKEAPSALVNQRNVDAVAKTPSVPAAAPPPPSPPPPPPPVPVPVPVPVPTSGSRTLTIVVSVGVLAAAAFAGTYFGSQKTAAPPAPVTSSVPSASASTAKPTTSNGVDTR